MPSFQSVELKSGWSGSSRPIVSIRVAESARTGSSSIGRFQTLSSGKRVHAAATFAVAFVDLLPAGEMAVDPIAAGAVGPAIDKCEPSMAGPNGSDTKAGPSTSRARSP